MKQPYLCCNCHRGHDARTVNGRCQSPCNGELIDVKAWEASMLSHALQLAARLTRSQAVLVRSGQ